MPDVRPTAHPDIEAVIPTVAHLASSANLDELLVVAVYTAETVGQTTVTFERMVELAFRCFPTRFGLRGYAGWPDSVVVNKCWLRARTDRHWLTGSVRAGFRLTGLGREVAQRLIGSALHRPARRTLDSRTRESRLLAALKASNGFQRFSEGEPLSREDVADALLATADAPRSTLLNNIADFRAAARVYNDEEVDQFLAQAHASLQSRKNDPRFAGGMMKKREHHRDE